MLGATNTFVIAELLRGVVLQHAGRSMSMSEFERLGGKGAVKKWRDSVMVDEPSRVEDGMSLGSWLKQCGVTSMPKVTVKQTSMGRQGSSKCKCSGP
jgi:SAND domain